MDKSTLNSLPLELKIGQLFFIGLPGPEIDATASELLKNISPGGVCLFSRNIRERQQTRNLLDEIREKSAVPLFLSLDQEGGLVDRLRRVVTPMPAPNRIKIKAQARRFAEIVAEVTRLLGFNMNFAPVVDVIDENRVKFQNGLFSRAFGGSATEVVGLAVEFLQTMQDGGVSGCVKHFPGIGASEVDSHEELPQINIEESEIRSVDLAPYRAMFANQIAAVVMVAHAAYPKLDLQEKDQNGKLLPSSLSYNLVTNLLREELGFGGLAITDDLEMGAIMKHYGIGDACRRAILAGEDMLSICAGVDSIYTGYAAVLDAVKKGEITEERLDQALTRIAKAKSKLKDPPPFDDDRLSNLSTEIAEFNNDLN